MAIDDNTIYGITGAQIKDLANTINAKAETSDIPTVNDATLTIQKNSSTVDTFTANASADKTINITVPTTAADVSALPASTKYGASITMSIDNATYVVTTTLKDQDGNTLGTAQTIDLPLESVVVNGSYDSTNKKIILTLQNGNTIDIPVADLVAGLQSEITAQNKLSADLVDDSTTTNKFVTASDKTTWDGKQNALTAGSNITISGDTISATDTTYSAFTGATSQDAGSAGLVPAPAAGDEGKFLSGNGLWTTVSQYSLPIASANDLGGIKVGTNLSIDGTTGVLSATDTTYSAGTNVQINGTTISATDTTYSDFAGATAQQAGAAGLVPAPTTSDPEKYLKGDGTWDTPPDTTYSAGTNIQINGTTISATDTTYSDFTGTDGTAAGTAGLVPAPATTDTGKFLKADGTWDTAGATYTAGDGIDITNNVIKATNTGLARVLTVDDYNYHVSGNDDDGIAVWLLPAGLYQSPYMPIYDTSNHSYLNYSGLILVGGNTGANYRTITLFDTLGDTDSFILDGSTGQKLAGDYTTGVFVGKRSSTGDPSSSTKGKVGQMWENTTTHKLYMCTSATGGTYVWEEVAFGGGGGNPISAADWTALWAGTVENINGVGV